MSSGELPRRGLKVGLFGGIATIFLAAAGTIEAFEARRLVHDVVTLGNVLLALPAFLAPWIALRPTVHAGEIRRFERREAVVIGVVSGAFTGGLTIAAVAVVELFEVAAVRRIFVSVSPRLLDILTWQKGLPLAAIILILGGAALGAVGAWLRVLPPAYRRPLVMGLATTGIVALLQVIVPEVFESLGIPREWLYSRTFDGLTRLGAVVVFIVSTALAVVWSARGREVRRHYSELPPEGRKTINAIAILAILALAIYLPHLLGSVLSQILGQVAIFVLMGLGLNIVVGYAGLLDLGYVAFFAVGAYFLAVLTGARIVTSLGAQAEPAFGADLTFWVAVWFVIMIAAFTGLMIGAPVLRLRGDYLAIVTLGFGEIARVLITSNWLRDFTGGAQGLRDVTDASLVGFGFRPPQRFYWLVLAFVVLAVYVSWQLANSRVGRAWNAMREDEQVAEAMGISTIKYKLLAFAMGAAVGCLSGALFAVKLSTVQPDSFTILVSIQALALIILGGIGSIPGVLVGALVLIGLPELLREFQEFRLLMYGAALILIMILRPQGLIPNVRRMRELTEEEAAQDAWARRQEEGVAAAAPASITVGTGKEQME